jgi:hypothetical protein
MGVQVPGVRPAALSVESVRALDEFLRSRHVVRNVYAFALEPAQIERLVGRARPAFERAQTDLLAFADFLDRLVASDEKDCRTTALSRLELASASGGTPALSSRWPATRAGNPLVHGVVRFANGMGT